jgi:glycosyltransferase involved in cell wall biosynthesis
LNLGFYAPLKSPNHAVPSGDRAMARALMSALKSGGHDVTLASELRIYDPKGLSQTQADLRGQAKREIPRIIALGKSENWQGWITYHNYYKAPDLIGPTVAQALNIPYVLIEATRAKKRLNGPWAGFAKDAEAACDAAATILYLTERDAEALFRDAPEGQKLVHLHPFLDRETLPTASTGTGPMLCVAMMRYGDKLASYQLIANTLATLPHQDWMLDIAGDGPAIDEVKSMMAPYQNQVNFHGALDSDALAKLYGQASLLFWPGVNEAFGLTYLEAQAAGVPVVAQNRPGVCDVTQGSHPNPLEGTQPLAAAVSALLTDPDLRQTRATQARQFIQDNHLRNTATQILNSVLPQGKGPQK